MLVAEKGHKSSRCTGMKTGLVVPQQAQALQEPASSTPSEQEIQGLLLDSICCLMQEHRVLVCAQVLRNVQGWRCLGVPQAVCAAFDVVN
jgi:hypothetical protein